MRARCRWWAGVLLGTYGLGAVHAQTTLTETPAHYSTWGPASDAAWAAHWGLTAEEVERYHHYMAVEGQYFYRHLDPVMVLGLIETDPAQRARYAEQYLMGERRRIEAQTRFATLAAAVQFERFGLEKRVDFPPYGALGTVPRSRRPRLVGRGRKRRLFTRRALAGRKPPPRGPSGRPWQDRPITAQRAGRTASGRYRGFVGGTGLRRRVLRQAGGTAQNPKGAHPGLRTRF